ncbi:MAG TPA: chorismate mutase [Chloroflexota bacterium]|nr:chorismate mutase [Chloroflexota bacterium]
MAVRGIRGATTVESDQAGLIYEATKELLLALIDRNQIDQEQICSAWFTLTPDLTAAFPAYAGRQLGWINVPLVCACEIPVPGALARVVRVLLHYNTDLPQSAIHHVYLRGAVVLRQDLVDRFGAAPAE